MGSKCTHQNNAREHERNGIPLQEEQYRIDKRNTQGMELEKYSTEGTKPENYTIIGAMKEETGKIIYKRNDELRELEMSTTRGT